MILVQVCPVPYNQRPSNEYHSIKNSFKFSWTFQNSRDFFNSLMKQILISYTISYIVTCNVYNGYIPLNSKLIAELFLSTSSLSIIYLTQIYLAYTYVYNRLMLSVVTYEESGWYDGQTWIKSKEILVQDRLIGTYELKPKIIRLKAVLFSFMALFCVGLLVYILN